MYPIIYFVIFYGVFKTLARYLLLYSYIIIIIVMIIIIIVLLYIFINMLLHIIIIAIVKKYTTNALHFSQLLSLGNKFTADSTTYTTGYEKGSRCCLSYSPVFQRQELGVSFCFACIVRFAFDIVLFLLCVLLGIVLLCIDVYVIDIIFSLMFACNCVNFCCY